MQLNTSEIHKNRIPWFAYQIPLKLCAALLYSCVNLFCGDTGHSPWQQHFYNLPLFNVGFLSAMVLFVMCFGLGLDLICGCLDIVLYSSYASISLLCFCLLIQLIVTGQHWFYELFRREMLSCGIGMSEVKKPCQTKTFTSFNNCDRIENTLYCIGLLRVYLIHQPLIIYAT